MIYTVILAAGESSRMGSPKALLRTPDGRTFLQAIADTARAGGCGGVVVVVGPPHGDLVKRALPAGVAATLNPRPERGMLSSVQSGIAALPPGCSAALVWPVDVPKVQPATVRAILAASPGRIVIPERVQHRKPKGGHPLRIPRALFGELAALPLDGGLRALVDAHPAETIRLPVDDPGILIDYDTPADLANPIPRSS